MAASQAIELGLWAVQNVMIWTCVVHISPMRAFTDAHIASSRSSHR
jgi:hypothetical protein